jgi:transcriptional regulator with XRE-family HTH domain
MTAEQLRMARALLRLGIRELAEKAGVDKMVVQRLEAGRRAHSGTAGKVKAALEAMGIVFIGAVEPFYGPTVALRWGITPPSSAEGRLAGEDEDDEGSLDTTAWDECYGDLDAGQIASMRRYWTDATRWSRLSVPSKKALSRIVR